MSEDQIRWSVGGMREQNGVKMLGPGTQGTIAFQAYCKLQ